MLVPFCLLVQHSLSLYQRFHSEVTDNSSEATVLCWLSPDYCCVPVVAGQAGTVLSYVGRAPRQDLQRQDLWGRRIGLAVISSVHPHFDQNAKGLCRQQCKLAFVAFWKTACHRIFSSFLLTNIASLTMQEGAVSHKVFGLTQNSLENVSQQCTS